MEYYNLEYLPKTDFGFLENNDNTYRKYIASLFNKNDKPKNTSGWLVPKKILQVNSNNNSNARASGDILIESDLFIKKKTVVVKISKNEKLLNKDFEASKQLNSIKSPNYSKYLGLFSCKDDIKNYSKSKPLPEEFCKLNGKTNFFLFMPYYKLGSLAVYEPQNIDEIISIVNQFICASLFAYQKIGFLHNDFHIGNILLKPTSKETIKYNLNQGIKEIKTFGVEIIIFDFDRSTFNNKGAFDKYLTQIMTLINIYKLKLLEYPLWKDIDLKGFQKNLYKITNENDLYEFVGN